MNKWVVCLWLLMLISVVSVRAADGPVIDPSTTGDAAAQQQQVQLQVDSANRFLSAETGKVIKAAMENVKVELQSNQDENFQLIDARMQTFIDDAKVKVIFGGIGAMLLAGGLVALFISWSTKKYSFETYQKNMIGELRTEIDELKARIPDGMAEMREKTWELQAQPMGMTASGMLDQSQASDMTEFNQHQYDPAYEGSWVPPAPDQATGFDQFGQPIQGFRPGYVQQQDYPSPSNPQPYPPIQQYPNQGWQ